MADAILDQRADQPPPLDTVLLWLTSTVERDFAQRGVFPALRYANAQVHRAAAALHYLTPDVAESVLEDAIAREQSTSKGLRNAYGAHIKATKAAMKEAEERRTVFESAVAVCVYRGSCDEHWQGTKDQLRAQGIQLEGPWPHEPGGKGWALAHDSRGYKTRIKRLPTIWPGRYEAQIELPYKAQDRKEKRPAFESAEVELARSGLALMPLSAEGYRKFVADNTSRMFNFSFGRDAHPNARHGYSFDKESLADIQTTFETVIKKIKAAHVHFDAVRHSKVAQGFRAELAAADEPFQKQFADLVRPNTGILQGDAS